MVMGYTEKHLGDFFFSDAKLHTWNNKLPPGLAVHQQKSQTTKGLYFLWSFSMRATWLPRTHGGEPSRYQWSFCDFSPFPFVLFFAPLTACTGHLPGKRITLLASPEPKGISFHVFALWSKTRGWREPGPALPCW